MPDPGDLDGDGVPAEVDLDDMEEAVGAVLPERLCDGLDQDGDEADDPDPDRAAAAMNIENQKVSF